MEKDLKEKVSIVTGGGSGIGQATAYLYADHGAKVVVSDINEQAARNVANQINQKGGKAIFVTADVSKPEDCERLVNETIKEFGRLDIAFNNAGIGGESNPIAEMTIDGWNKIIAVNLSSVFYCMKFQLQKMEAQGSGCIVNNSSILGSVGFLNSSGYVAAKHGLIGLTKNAALEYSAKGIRINAIGPAFINTPLLTEAGIVGDIKDSLVKLHPIGRFGEANEVAELVVWLSSDKASFATGSYYAVDGGYLAQ